MNETLDLSTFNWPEVTELNMAFSTFDTIPELLEEARRRDLKKGEEKFNELFFNGGSTKFQKDVKGTWKEKAWLYCMALMRSFEPKHEDKTSVCAMIMEEVLIL